MKMITLFALLGLFSWGSAKAQKPEASEPKAVPLGTWREGFKGARAKALTFRSWNELYDWAEKGKNAIVIPLRFARSTDLAGGRQDYVDTRAGGYKDGCQGIFDEMRFIGTHNGGDTKHFFKMTQDWIKMQNSDETIPPGHF